VTVSSGYRMNKIERVQTVLDGHKPDRPPLSFWNHFAPDELAGARAVEAHLRNVETYDLDFLKIMDDNRYPRPQTAGGVVRTVVDLERLSVLRGDEDSFGRQLELIGALASRFRGQLLMTTTVFNSWTTLRNMTEPASDVHGPPTLDETRDSRDATLTRLWREAPTAFERAISVITESTANFARHCLAAGADGIFLSLRDDWVDTPENGPGLYDRLVKPSDLQLLAAAAAGRFNMLHVCGKALDFDRFATYPVHVINWADRYAGPTIAEALQRVRPAICAGLDNLGTMVGGTPDECAAEVTDALRQAGTRPILVAPGCTFDPKAVPVENLQAIRKAVTYAASAC
jgi:uroporphyrinogen decarboxylase